MLVEIIPFLITAIVTVIGVALGTFLFKILWYIYGRLELEKYAYITPPITVEIPPHEWEVHHYVKVVVKNNSKKAFEEVKPVVVLKGEGSAEYISGRPYYEIETSGEICWGGLVGPVKTIYPGEIAYIDLFRVERPTNKPEECRYVKLELPSENGWSKPRSLMVKRDGEVFEPKEAITCNLFLSLNWDIELRVLSKNGSPIIVKLDVESMKKALRDNLTMRRFKILQ